MLSEKNKRELVRDYLFLKIYATPMLVTKSVFKLIFVLRLPNVYLPLNTGLGFGWRALLEIVVKLTMVKIKGSGTVSVQGGLQFPESVVRREISHCNSAKSCTT